MPEELRERMARAIAAAVFRSQGVSENAPAHPVMADRRQAAVAAADAALKAIRAGDDLGGGLVAVEGASTGARL